VRPLRFGDILDKRFAAIWILVLLMVLYGWINPLRLGHTTLILVFVALVVASPTSRRLAVALWPAAIFGFAYDLMRILVDRAYDMTPSRVVFELERWLVGWVTPNPDDLGPLDLFREHHSLIVDLAAGAWYSTHVPSVILFGLYIWWRTHREREVSARRLDKYFWGFLIFNVLGFVFWAIFPVAPPWYVEAHGLVAPGAVGLDPLLGDPAALVRVDAWLGYPHFSDIYKQATYVFGAMPSLHAAAPVWVALWTREKWLRLLVWCYALAMCFFAVYLNHHYVVDVLAGALLAAGVYALLEHSRLGDLTIRANQWLRDWLDELLGAELSADGDEEARGE
jgi:membrane-associated phospholipid phosphatase